MEYSEESCVFHYVLVVWGEEFTEFFLRFSLPSQLSPGNFPKLSSNKKSLYNIYTTADNAARIRAHSSYAALERLIAVQIHVVGEDFHALLRTHSVYELLTVFDKHAIQSAVQKNAFLVFLGPDALMSNGTLRVVEEHARQGYDALMIAGPRATMEDIEPWLEQKAFNGGPINFSGDELAGCVLRHPHHATLRLHLDSPHYDNVCPSQLYARSDDRLMIAHHWHLHPLMIKAIDRSDQFLYTIDADYVKCIGGEKKIHIVRDSDHICMIEVSRRNHLNGMFKDNGPFDREAVLDWAQKFLSPVHLKFFQTPIIFHDGPINSQNFSDLTEKIEPTVNFLLEKMESFLSRRLPTLTTLSELSGGVVFLYGTGAAGRALRDVFLRNDIQVAGFVDSFTSGILEGLPIHLADTLPSILQPGDQVVIASMHRADIAHRLTELGIGNALDGYEFYTALQHGPQPSFAITTLPSPCFCDAHSQLGNRG